MFVGPNNGRRWWEAGDIQLSRCTRGVADVVDSLSVKERKEFSIVAAINSMVTEVGGELEREISAAIATKLSREPERGGLYIPTRIRPQASGLDTKTDGAGKYTVATEVRDLIELLQNKTRVIQLGATVFSGLTGNVQFPRELAATSGRWMDENSGSDVPASDAAFGFLNLNPKTFMATTSFSRQLLQQSTIDAENFVRNDLATAHSLAIDLAALDGTGEDNQPLGLLRTPGVGSVTMGPSGGAPTYAKIVDLETAIADVNADADRMKILTTPIMRGILKKTPAVNTTYGALPVWQNSGSPGVGDVAGYQGYVSKQVPATKVTTDLSHSDCHCIILGYWPSLYVGEWGLLTLIVDPYTAKKRGMIEVTSFQMVDIGVRHPESFAAIQDARNV